MLRRKTAGLRVGRASIAGAAYFITACTAGRRPVFSERDAAAQARSVLQRMVDDNDFRWLVGTVMPDHVHVLFELGDRLPLTGCVAKIKGLIARSPALPQPLWQENVFEHRVRTSERTEDYAFYIFMNPYRAKLCRMTAAWPWWICTKRKRFRFLDNIDAAGAPPIEWLERDDTAGGTLVVGE